MENVRNDIQKTVQALYGTLNQELGSNMLSLTLVGSAVTDDFVSGKSDINSVLVVNNVDEQFLSVLAAMGPQMGRKRLRAPLLMTPSYIERSCDVFAVEWLDFQKFHQTVHGADPFESLTFQKEHVRLQCEKQLKSILIQIRQGYISSAEKKDILAAVLTSAAKELLPYLRAMLWLEDVERLGNCQDTFEQIKTRFSVDMQPLKTAFAFRYEKLRKDSEQIKLLFTQAYKVIESLSDIADQWGK